MIKHMLATYALKELQKARRVLMPQRESYRETNTGSSFNALSILIYIFHIVSPKHTHVFLMRAQRNIDHEMIGASLPSCLTI